MGEKEYSKKDVSFLREKLHEYYKTHEITGPEKIDTREFGIGEFGKKIAARHLNFNSDLALNNYLKSEVPAFISYSLALYKYPSKTPMEKKEVLSSDIVYEFDADDIPTACKNKHDFWKCENCQTTGKGLSEICTNCLKRVKVNQWFCTECVGKTKEQTLKLIKILEDDFEAHDFITVNFSGNAGFHLHLSRDLFSNLSREAKIELLNYLSLFEVDLEKAGFYVTKEGALMMPSQKELGTQRKRISDTLKSFLLKGEDKLFSLTGTKKDKLSIFSDSKRIDKYFESEMLPALSGIAKTSERFYSALLEAVKDSLSLAIDRQTSVDEKKIIRVPDTIHGGSMLPAERIPLEKFKDYEPFSPKSFSSKEIKVFIKDSPEFSLGGEKFKAMKQTEENLPEFAALYLIAKRKATLEK